VNIDSGKLTAGAGSIIIDQKGVKIREDVGSVGGSWVGVAFYSGGDDWNDDVILSISPESRGTNADFGGLFVGRVEIDKYLTAPAKVIWDWNLIAHERVGPLNGLGDNNTRWFTLPTNAADVDDVITATGGSGTLALPFTTSWEAGGSSTTNHLFTNATASGNLAEDAYGVFRYATDANASGADTLGFYSGQTSASTSISIDRSAFWIMESESGYLRFEPNIAYSGANNNATIGLTNPLVYLRSYYVQAGNGTYTAPGLSFYNDPNTGFYTETSDTMNIALGGVQKYRIDGSNFRPTNNGIIDLGASGTRWEDVWAENGTIQTSDLRDKTDIQSTTLGLDFIKSLNPVSYKWKTKPEKQTHYGMIAQEVLETLKDHGIDSIQDFGGITGDDETHYGARYTEFVPILIKAIQELSDKIKKLEGDE
jgi:hypothetical protein